MLIAFLFGMFSGAVIMLVITVLLFDGRQEK